MAVAHPPPGSSFPILFRHGVTSYEDWVVEAARFSRHVGPPALVDYRPVYSALLCSRHSDALSAEELRFGNVDSHPAARRAERLCQGSRRRLARTAVACHRA